MPDFFSVKEKEEIVQAIAQAEKRTSGEIRVHVEAKAGKEPMARAEQVFYRLGMDQTADRNGVLFYLAVKDRKFVILGDQGIDQKTPADFWEGIRDQMAAEFAEGRFVSGVIKGIDLAGQALAEYFPYQNGDVDELTNEVSDGA